MSLPTKVVREFISGNPDATGQVFEEYKNLLYFIIATYVSNKDVCDDILSETYIKAMDHRQELKDPNSIKGFLSSIAKNEALHYLRDNKTILVDSLDEMYGDNDKNNTLLDLFGPLLSSKETIVVYYRAVFSYSWKEILEETGIPISSAKKIYKVAKEKLRKELL